MRREMSTCYKDKLVWKRSGNQLKSHFTFATGRKRRRKLGSKRASSRNKAICWLAAKVFASTLTILSSVAFPILQISDKT